MRRSQQCAVPVSGRTISPLRMAREARQLVRIVSGAMSIRFARCQRVVILCAVRRPRSSLDFAATWNSREAPQTLALSRADHGRRRKKFDDHPRDLQLATEIDHCVARAPACKNYVEVRLIALGSEPRNSSISASERSSPAHSCDLCIGVGMVRSSPRRPVIQPSADPVVAVGVDGKSMASAKSGRVRPSALLSPANPVAARDPMSLAKAWAAISFRGNASNGQPRAVGAVRRERTKLLPGPWLGEGDQ